MSRLLWSTNSFGGYPPPSLDLYIGRRDVTEHFRFAHSAAMSGLRGLRTINYRTERRTDALAVRADDRRGRRSLESTNRKSYMARRRGYYLHWGLV